MSAETYADRGYNSPEHETLDGILTALTRIADHLDGKNKPVVIKFDGKMSPVDAEAIRARLGFGKRSA